MAASNMADALAVAAREIGSPSTLEETLSRIVQAAARSVDGMEHVGISLGHSSGEIETVASTDHLVDQLDQLQYDLGEGPCLYAVDREPVIVVENAAREHRWPRFIPAAVQEGLRSQIGLRLYADDQTLGGLNLYSTTQDSIHPDVVHIAELFAAHAAIALQRSIREADLNQALSTQKMIGQAIGILMERYQMDEDQAFKYLVRVSSYSGVKLRDVAAAVNEQARATATKTPRASLERARSRTPAPRSHVIASGGVPKQRQR